MYVYVRSEPTLFTVGFYDPDGQWHAHQDYESRNEAAKQVAYLNGVSQDTIQEALDAAFRMGYDAALEHLPPLT